MKTLRNFLIALGVTFAAYVLIEGNNSTFSLPDWDLDSFFTADDSDNKALYNQEMEDEEDSEYSIVDYDEDGTVYMTGPATEVFSLELEDVTC